MEQALTGDLGWHAAMLLDEIRVAWFARAVAATVCPGDIVVDLGSGTGLLAMLAARAGARRVYAVEQSPIVEIAEELIQTNGLADQVVVISSNSFDVTLPEKADVVISETLGAWGADEGICAIMADALSRLSVSNARLLPSELILWVAPATLTAPTTLAHLSALKLDYSPFFQRLGPSPSHGAQAKVIPSRLLAPARKVLSLVLGKDNPDQRRTIPDFDLPVGTRCDALVGWFTAISSGIEPLSTGPSDPSTMWGQVIVPLSTPVAGTLRLQLDFTFGPESMEVDLLTR